MNSPDEDDLLRELELFREEAQARGIDPDAELSRLESSDDFVARMRRQEAHTRRGRRRFAFASAGAVAAGLAVVAGVIVSPSPQAEAETPPILDYEFSSAVRIAYAGGEDASETLSRLASAAAATPSPSMSGSFQYKVADSWFSQEDADGSAKIVPEIRETWMSPDGGLVSSTRRGRPLRSDGRGVTDDAPADARPIVEKEAAGTFDASLARDLPRTAEGLTKALLESAGCETTEPGPTRAACLYREVLFIFQNYVVDSDTTAEIWAMLSREKGIVNLGSVEDRAGRDGVGISVVDPLEPEYRNILIASEETGRPLGYEQILIKPVEGLDVPAPSVTSFSSFLESRWVKSAPEVAQ